MRIFVTSDLHFDYQENERWFANLSNSDFQKDIIIIAGDISENIQTIQRCFELLCAKFLHVLFVPGNHDLWIYNDKNTKSSLDRFTDVMQLAEKTGVVTQPFQYNGVGIIPLLGWYDFEFGMPNEDLQQAWMDFKACRWPDDWSTKDITRFFTDKNTTVSPTDCTTLISFSHFLPRIDILPAFIPVSFDYLHPIMGSPILEKQVRILNPDIHIYGHSHINQHITLDAITYINNAFGYPSETRIAKKALQCVFEQ